MPGNLPWNRSIPAYPGMPPARGLSLHACILYIRSVFEIQYGLESGLYLLDDQLSGDPLAGALGRAEGRPAVAPGSVLLCFSSLFLVVGFPFWLNGFFGSLCDTIKWVPGRTCLPAVECIHFCRIGGHVLFFI